MNKKYRVALQQSVSLAFVNHPFTDGLKVKQLQLWVIWNWIWIIRSADTDSERTLVGTIIWS